MSQLRGLILTRRRLPHPVSNVCIVDPVNVAPASERRVGQDGCGRCTT